MKKTHRKKVNILIIYTLLIALLLNGCSIKRKNIWDEMQFSIRGVSVDFITTFTLQEFIDKTGYKNISFASQIETRRRIQIYLFINQ